MIYRIFWYLVVNGVGEGMGSVLGELFREYREQLLCFFNGIDEKRAERVLELFLRCKGSLFFTGVGKSGVVAEKLVATMVSTGTKAFYLSPVNALHGDIGIVSSEDILICISKSGESEELLTLLPFVQARKAKTVAWVSNPQSRLFRLCDVSIHLPVEKEMCPFDLAPTTSVVVQLIFGDVLSVALMRAKRFSLEEYALNHPLGAIGKKIRLKVEHLMLRGKDLPLCRPEDRLRDVLVELTNKRCGSILVVGEGEQMEGIFTDGDLRRVLQRDPTTALGKKMEALMTTAFLSVQRGERAWDALRLMQNHSRRVMALPVFDRDRLIGLIHMHDIVQAGIR